MDQCLNRRRKTGMRHAPHVAATGRVQVPYDPLRPAVPLVRVDHALAVKTESVLIMPQDRTEPGQANGSP